MKNGPYELVIAPENWQGELYRKRYCYEHHLVYWQNTGLLVEKGKVIHHKNGDRRDNIFENLEIMSIAKHNRFHKKTEKVTVQCAFCGKQTEKLAREFRYKVKHGQTDFYCNRSCMARDFGRGRGKYNKLDTAPR